MGERGTIAGVMTAVLCAWMGGRVDGQQSHASAEASQALRDVEAFERLANESNPPETILDLVHVRPGMVVGEVGARHGRIAIPLARRVGPSGKVYANDIDAPALSLLRARAAHEELANLETVVGKVDDPLFPQGALDMVLFVWTYHEVSQPAALLKGVAATLKPGGTVALVEPRVVTRSGLEADAGPAGLQLIEVNETALSRNNVYILRKR